jgi:hypothetical protein
MAVSETVCIAMIVRQSRIAVDCFYAQLNTSLVSLKAVCLKAAFLWAFNKGQGGHCLPLSAICCHFSL